MQVNLNRPRLADQTVVLGLCGDVSGHTQTTTTDPHPAQTTTEQPLPRQPNFPESPCLVSRSSTLQEHGFNAEVQKELLLLRDSQLGPSTLLSGQSSKDGAQRNRWTSGIPL